MSCCASNMTLVSSVDLVPGITIPPEDYYSYMDSLITVNYYGGKKN